LFLYFIISIIPTIYLFLKNRYDIIHVFFGIPSGPLGVIGKFISKTPLIISLRGSDVPGYSEKRFGFYYKILKPVIKKIWNYADAVVANSRGLKELALNTDSNLDIKVITNGISPEYLHIKKNFKKPELLKILSVGRLIDRKDYVTSLKAVSEVYKTNKNIEFHIIGSGPKIEFLKHFSKISGIDKIVEFAGEISNTNTLLKYYRESDIFLLTSLSEGMPNVILEAMAAGLPIISTDVQGTDELVKNNINGFIVKKNDFLEISKKIIKFIDNPNLLIEMSNNSYSTVKNFLWKNIAEDYISLYKEINQCAE
jgi:glycosyltransferase involved in cell wall biosynthesis